MNTTGYYGKLPQRGDFVSGRIPTTFKNTWDDWAQQLVITSNELKLASEEDNLWYKLPVYRFYLSSMVAGDNAWIGLMLPSCDSVGRLFPFCFARDIDEAFVASAAFEQHEDYFAALENLVENLFTEQLKFEALNDTLQQIDSQTSVVVPTDTQVISRQNTEQALSIRVTEPYSPNDSNFWQTTASALLSVACGGHSVWTTSQLSNSSNETLICEAMPSASCCKSLFNCDFDQQHWTKFISNTAYAEQRDTNIFAQAKSTLSTPIPTDEDGDTKPIHKLPAEQIPRDTDFLDLDESDNTDAPWDS